MNFLDLLTDSRPHVFDGAMGTMLSSEGVCIHRCYHAQHVQEPDLVREVHRAYVKAGAELIETNSFGANALKLAEYGLETQVVELNAADAKIAREAANGRALVGGAMGPLGIRIEPYGPTSHDEARAIFGQQVTGLLEGGVDFFILETFADLEEIHAAILAVREMTDLPIVAQMTVPEDGTTLYGTQPETLATQLEEWNVDVIGLNCSVGPHGILSAIEQVAPHTTRKLSAQPNAGLPREIHGRKMYMASPEYMAKFSQRLIRAGVKFVGGCCGTTPEHIRRIADAVHALAPGRISIQVATPEQQAQQVEPKALGERSNWGRKIAAGELVTTVEIVPPRGIDPSKML